MKHRGNAQAPFCKACELEPLEEATFNMHLPLNTMILWGQSSAECT